MLVRVYNSSLNIEAYRRLIEPGSTIVVPENSGHLQLLQSGWQLPWEVVDPKVRQQVLQALPKDFRDRVNTKKRPRELPAFPQAAKRIKAQQQQHPPLPAEDQRSGLGSWLNYWGNK